MTTTNWLRGQTLVADDLDAAFGRCIDRSGDVMTGLLTLAGDPSSSAHAATKQYVDNTIATSIAGAVGPPGPPGGMQILVGGWNAATNTPTLASGALANGSVVPAGHYYIVTNSGSTPSIDGNTTWVAGDYAVSNGTIWMRVFASGTPYLPLVGGTLSGALTAPALTVTGVTSYGSGANNIMTVTPGATTASTIVFTSSGAAGFQFATNPVTAATTNVGNNRTLNTASTSMVPAFHALLGSLTGTVTGQPTPAPFDFIIGGDTVDASAAANGLSGLRISQSYGNSASMKGGRYAMTVQGNLVAGTQTGNKAAGISPFYGAANFWVTMANSEGGTAPTLLGGNGQAIVLNPQLVLSAAATNWAEASLAEWNIAVQTGASVARKAGIKVTQLSSDAVQGNVTDAAIKFGGAVGAVGWRTGILFGGDVSQWGYRGTLIKTEYSNTQASAANTSNWGIDLLEDAFLPFASGGGSFRSQGFTVGGDGVVQIGKTLLSPSAAGLAIDTIGYIGTPNATPSAGGSGYSPGDILIFGGNGRAIVVTAPSGGVATFTVLNQPYNFTGSPPATLAAPAYLSSSGPGSGCVLNMTWVAATTLALQPSGGRITMPLLTNAANDAGAASAGVPVGAIYRNGSVMMQRVA